MRSEYCVNCAARIVVFRGDVKWYHCLNSSRYCNPGEALLNMHTADRATPPTFIIQEEEFG